MFEASTATYSAYAQEKRLGFAHRIHQTTRYEGLLRHVVVDGRSVLDYGCGHADLLVELALRGVWPSSYEGVDLLEENLALARANIEEQLGIAPERPGVRLLNEPDGEYDVACCLAVLSVDEGEATLDLWMQTLEELLARTREALVFDLLRVEPGFAHEGHKRIDSGEIARIAARLSPSHVIDNTLADHYSLVVVRKQPTSTRIFWGLRK